MEERFGGKELSARERLFISPLEAISEKNIPVLLLVEDNPDDVELTRVALDDSKLANLLVVVPRRSGSPGLALVRRRAQGS